MQIGAKMVHRPTMGNQTHKHTMVQICKALIILIPIIYFVISDEGYIKMTNCPKIFTSKYQFLKNLSSYEFYNIVGS
jgi:hypothetical protein